MANTQDPGTKFENVRALITFVREPSRNRNDDMQVTGLMSIGPKGENQSRNFIASKNAYNMFVKQGVTKGSIVYVDGYDHAKTVKNRAGEMVDVIDSSLVRISVVPATVKPAAEAEATAE